MWKWGIICICFMPVTALAQYSLTGAYSQDFQGLGTIDLAGVSGGDLGLVDIGLAGWYFKEMGAGANESIPASDGSHLQGDTYNYGSLLATDRGLGGMQSGTLLPVFGWWLVNNTGQTITSLGISFTGEQWRLGQPGRNDRLDCQYSQNATSLDNGHWLDIQVLDFIAPVSSGTAGPRDGNHPANRVQFSYTFSGLQVPEGGSFFIRWVDFNASGADDGLAVDDFSIVPGFSPAATGFFRSVSSGEWMDPNTWEYAADNINWTASSFVPSAAAGTVTIRNSHTIAFNGFLPIDEVQIENGGVCDFRNGILTINDGSGGGVSIQGGGMMVLQAASNPPVFASAAAHIDIRAGGIVRVAASGLTNTAGGGVHAANFIYRHQSILEFDLPTAFGSVGVTYFPHADASTIPVFRTLQPIGVAVGSVSSTTINGVFEAMGNVTFANTGQKIFRNGIRGPGNINGSTSGKFIINGNTAVLAGSGALVVPLAGGLEIGSATGTLLSLGSDKSVTGNIVFAPSMAGTYIDLHQYHLHVSGNIMGATPDHYVRTGPGGGRLTLSNTGVGGRTFPIGETSFNSVTVALTSGTAAVTAGVRTGIQDPAGPIPADAVMRTWYLQASAPVLAQLSFQYGTHPGELSGAAASQPTLMELLRSDQVAWHLVPGNDQLMPAVFPGPQYQVTTVNAVPLGMTSSAFALGKAGTIVLPGGLFVSCSASDNDRNAMIQFEVNDHGSAIGFVIERSINNRSFDSIGWVMATREQSHYSYPDHFPMGDGIYYRVKALRNGKPPVYSSVVRLNRHVRGPLDLAIHPNPVRGNIWFEIRNATRGNTRLTVWAMDGRLIHKTLLPIQSGNSRRSLDIPSLARGNYILVAETPSERASMRFTYQGN